MNERKATGSATEIKVMLAFIELGYNVSSPYGDCERYDFIADIDGKLVRVQCKTCIPHDGGRVIEIDFRKKRHTSKGEVVCVVYNEDEIDYYATEFKGQTYLLDIKECGTRRRLRIKDTKSGQMKGISWASDYEIEKVIEKIKEEQNA